MLLRWCGLLLTLCAGSLWAADAQLKVTLAHEVVRPGLPFKISLQVENPGSGARMVSAIIAQNNGAVASSHTDIDDAAQLSQPLFFHLIPSQEMAAESCIVQVTIEGGPGRPLKEQISIPSWPQWLQEIVTLSTPPPPVADAHARLFIEQAALLSTQPPTLAAVDRMRQVHHRLQLYRQNNHQQPHTAPQQTIEHAYPCPIDNSPVPVRVTLPAQPARAVVHVLRSPPANLNKMSWPSLPPTWVTQAMAAHLALIEWYPAADHAFDDLAGKRFLHLWPRVVSECGVADAPQVLLSSGAAQLGARQLLMRDDALVGLIIDNPRQVEPLAAIPGISQPQQRWLNLRRTAPAAPTHLICGIVGTVPQRWETFSALPTIAEDLDRPAVWTWIAAQVSMPQRAPRQHMLSVVEPGVYRSLEIQAMHTWGLPGEVQVVHHADGVSLQGRQVTKAHWRGPQPAEITLGVQPAIAQTGKIFGQVQGPLASYSEGPFVVVIGRSGDVATNIRNRELAQKFLNDWVAHSHGAAAWSWDDTFDASAWPDHHLVLIGTAHSHRVVAALDQANCWPNLSFGQRYLAFGEHRLLASQPFGLGVVRPHPDRPDRAVVLLAGDAWWPSNPAHPPLAGQPDVIFRPLAGYNGGTNLPQALAGLYDGNWQWPDAD